MDTEQVQGYIPTVKHKGKRRFVAFKGGLTRDPDQARCEPFEDAWKTARAHCRSFYDVPGVVPVDQHGRVA